jgi:hypothetical protein
MLDGSQQAITHVLQQDSRILETLIGKLKHLKQIEQLLNGHLDDKLAKHYQIANLENNCLTVITEKAIWATQFRFQIPQLLNQLRQHPEFYQLKHIYCKIQPKNHPSKPANVTPMPQLSAETAAIVLETAKTIRHEKLQAIMNRIASHAQKKS